MIRGGETDVDTDMNTESGNLPKKVNRGTLAEIPQICIDAFCERIYTDGEGNSLTNPSVENTDNVDVNGCDEFNNNSNCSVSWNTNRAYFLTHFDDGILEDVLNVEFLNMLMDGQDETVRLYMHELSYEFLLYCVRKEEDDFDEVFCLLLQLRQKSKIVFLEVDSPIKLIFPAENHAHVHAHPHGHNELQTHPGLVIQVTTLSAGHNVGSIMLLFERLHLPHTPHALSHIAHGHGRGKGDYFDADEDEEQELRILYTGACRLQLSDLTNFRALYHKCGDQKIITSLYIDTMYCLPYIEELPSRKAIEDDMLEMIAYHQNEIGRQKNQPVQATLSAPAAPCQFEIWTQNPAACSLNFIRSIVNAFKQPVRISRRLSIFFEQIPNLKWCWQSTECKKPTDFHYNCGSVENERDRRRTIGPVFQIAFQCKMHRQLTGTNSEPTQDEVELFDNSNCIYSSSPQSYTGIYCSHLSKFELARMVNFFQTPLEAESGMNVKPLYCPQGMHIQDVLKEIKRACEDVAECQPGDFEDENPCKVYDYTDVAPSRIPPTSMSPKKLKGVRPRRRDSQTNVLKRVTEFYHYYDEDLYHSLNRDEHKLLLGTDKATVTVASVNGEGDHLPPKQTVHFDNLPASPSAKAKIRTNNGKMNPDTRETSDTMKPSLSSSALNRERERERRYAASR